MNKDFKKYLEGYCKKHNISKEEAMKHVMVKEAKKQYNEKDTTTRAVGWKEA